MHTKGGAMLRPIFSFILFFSFLSASLAETTHYTTKSGEVEDNLGNKYDAHMLTIHLGDSPNDPPIPVFRITEFRIKDHNRSDKNSESIKLQLDFSLSKEARKSQSDFDRSFEELESELDKSGYIICGVDSPQGYLSAGEIAINGASAAYVDRLYSIYLDHASKDSLNLLDVQNVLNSMSKKVYDPLSSTFNNDIIQELSKKDFFSDREE